MILLINKRKKAKVCVFIGIYAGSAIDTHTNQQHTQSLTTVSMYFLFEVTHFLSPYCWRHDWSELTVSYVDSYDIKV